MTKGDSTTEAGLVERLRIIRGTQFTSIENELVTEAADTIESLQTQLRDAREALVAARSHINGDDYHADIIELIDDVLGTG